MLFPLRAQTAMDGEAQFACERMQQPIHYSKCMSWFVDHNALRRKSSPCFKCGQGQANREAYAKS